MRMTFCKTLILLRNKNLLQPTALLSLFFELLKCEDKILRTFLKNHIITDIKNINSKNKNAKVNSTLQNFMFTMFEDTHDRAAKMSADIMIELYKKNIWNDAKTVNVIAKGCFSNSMKVFVTCLKFFLGTDEEDNDNNNSDSDSDDEPNIKDVMMANKVNKKSKKRDKQLKKVKQLYVKTKKKKSNAPVFNFSALHLIYDPQTFAEKLFKRHKKVNNRFEIKLMTLDVISRLIGLHNLFLFNFYPYIQRFLNPHQRDVTKLLQFIAQSSHELIPPEYIQPVLKTLVSNFITERNSADVMAIGLNAVREICSRCPLVMDEDLLRDLAKYKLDKNKSVMMAARSLIGLYRQTMPDLLHKKDRGRPTEATMTIETLKYGESKAKDYIPGADVLLKELNSDEEMEIDSDDDDDGEWIDVHHDEDDDDDNVVVEDKNKKNNKDKQNDNEEDDDDNKEDDEDEEENDDDKEKKQIRSAGKPVKRLKKQKRTKLDRKKEKLLRLASKKIEKKEELTAETKAKAAQISVEKILTDEDFKRIDSALIKRQMTNAKRGLKRPLEEENRGELVKLGDIENIYKKRHHNKDSRMQSVMEGRQERERFGYKDGRQNPLCSKTNREKKKTKAFAMVKHKVRSKIKRSFKDKQIALRNHLVKQKKMK